jgi:hypothetical protein
MSPEEEAKKAAIIEFDRLKRVGEELDISVNLEETEDYVILFVLMEDRRSSGRRLLLKLKCDDYPQQAPFLECLNPEAFNNHDLWNDVRAEFYPKGPNMVVDLNRSSMPIMCIPGHRLYYANGWHQPPWINPPKEQHSIYGFVTRVRSAFFDTWVQKEFFAA